MRSCSFKCLLRELCRFKFSLFCRVFRVLEAADLERKLQAWPDGKESGVWIPLECVILRSPGVTANDFQSYLQKWYAKDPILRGFFLHELRRKVVAVFIFDRYEAQIRMANASFHDYTPSWQPSARRSPRLHAFPRVLFWEQDRRSERPFRRPDYIQVSRSRYERDSLLALRKRVF